MRINLYSYSHKTFNFDWKASSPYKSGEFRYQSVNRCYVYFINPEFHTVSLDVWQTRDLIKPAKTAYVREKILSSQKATHSLTSMVFLSTVDAMLGRTMIPSCSRADYSGFGGDTSKRKCLFVGCTDTPGAQTHTHARSQMDEMCVKNYTCLPVSFNLSTARNKIRSIQSDTFQHPEDKQISAARVWNSVMHLAVDVL